MSQLHHHCLSSAAAWRHTSLCAAFLDCSRHSHFCLRSDACNCQAPLIVLLTYPPVLTALCLILFCCLNHLYFPHKRNSCMSQCHSQARWHYGWLTVRLRLLLLSVIGHIGLERIWPWQTCWTCGSGSSKWTSYNSYELSLSTFECLLKTQLFQHAWTIVRRRCDWTASSALHTNIRTQLNSIQYNSIFCLWSYTKVCEHSIVKTTCGNFTKHMTAAIALNVKKTVMQFARWYDVILCIVLHSVIQRTWVTSTRNSLWRKRCWPRHVNDATSATRNTSCSRTLTS